MASQDYFLNLDDSLEGVCYKIMRTKFLKFLHCVDIDTISLVEAIPDIVQDIVART